MTVSPPHRLKIIFMGTPEFALPALMAIHLDQDFEVIAVYTQPPRPAGRGQKLKNSVIHDYAAAQGLPIFTPSSFKKDPNAVTQFQSLNADIAVVAAYGLILPPAILAAPRLGCLNIHGSLLPRWRGAAPIQRAIAAGDSETGITVMQMELGLDTGPMLMKSSVPITSITTAQSLHDELSHLGATMIVDVLDQLYRGQPLTPEVQDNDLANYASLLSKDEGKIDWAQSAIKIDRKIRAFTPWPGGWCVDNTGKRFKILRGTVPDPQLAIGLTHHTPGTPAGTILTSRGHIACGEGSIYQILEIQPENNRAMGFEDCVNGQKLRVGARLA